MAAAVELATAYITVAASGSDLAPSFGRSFRAVEKVAGDSGKRMGKALTGQIGKATEQDVDKAKSAYEQASKRVTSTAERQATKVESARRKEEIAQTKVTEALAKYPKESSQVLTAQDRLALASQKVEAAQRDQQSAMDRANRELDETTRSLRDTEKAAESAATPFQRLGDRVKSALHGDFKDAFKPVEREGEDAANEIEKDFKASGDDSAHSFGTSFKAGLAGFAGGIIATIGIDKLKQAGGAIWEIGASFDDMADTIRIGTGASGSAFEDLQQSAKNIASTIPADFDLVGTTVADLNTRLGLSGDTLETVASQYLQAGNILGEDVDVQSTTAAFSAFKLEGDAVSGAMDTLFQVSQATGIGFNDLAGAVQQNAPALQNLGFSFEETASMVGLLDKSGLNADQVMSSLSKSLVTLAKDGEEPASAFSRVTGEIQGFVDAGDVAGATDLASKVFGTRGASQFVGALQSGKLNMEDLQSTVGATGDTILALGEETADFPEKWQTFKNKALLALEPVGNALFSLGGDAMGALASWVEKIDFTSLADGVESVVAGGKSIWDILVNGDFTGGLFGLSEDSGTVDFLFDLREAAMSFGGFLTNSVIPGLQGVVGWLKENQAWLIPVAAGILAIVGAWKLYQTWLLIVSGVTKAYTAVQAAFNAVMAMNPIGLIVLAIIGLAAAFVVAYKRSETFRNIVNGVWDSIKAAAGAVADWFMNHVWPVMKAAWDGIAAGALWLYNSAILPAWNGIQAAIGAVVSWITGTLWPALQAAWSAIGTAAMWLWKSVIQPVWTGIKLAIAIAVTAVMVYIDLLAWYFSNVIAPVALWLYNNVIKPAWAGIQAAISAVVKWVKNVGWPTLKLAIDWIANAFKWLYSNVISPVWSAIRTAISAVVSWLQNTAWPLISTVIGWLKTSFNGWKLLAQAVWSAIQTAINAVVAWFRDTAWPLISTVLGKIKDGFTAMKGRLKSIWDSVKNAIIKPVVDWITGTVKPKFDTFTDNVKTAFTTLKDGVLAAWDAIKDGMKKPINGVIGIYNDHIAGNFNKVIETIFGKDGGEKYKLTEMTPFATGGILPGQSSWRDGDDQIISARRGEGVLVSEGLRDRESQSMFLQANEAARTRGVSFANFVSGAFAGGGIVKLRNPFSGSHPKGDGFGARNGRHDGIDWPMPSGAVLKAVGAGNVNHTWNPNAGNKLELSLGDGLVAGYHHLSSFIAGEGSSVGRGADVARVGSTGRSSGPHLHFSLKRDGKYVDPAPYLAGGGEAGSGGGDSWWNPFDGLWGSIKDKVSAAVGEGTMGGVLSGVVENTVGGIAGWVADKLNVFDWGSDSGGSGGAGGAERWRDTASQALQMKSMLSPSVLDSLMRRMNQESGGDPRAINNWDSNAAAGMPSKGLMQVIPPTFNAYAEPGYASDIYDPLSNILASINYTKSAYGSLTKGWNRSGGYAEGGLVDGGIFDTGGVLDSGNFALNLSGRPEVVLNPNESKAYLAGQASAGSSTGDGGDTFNIYPESDKVPELMSELMWAQKTQKRSRGRYSKVG